MVIHHGHFAVQRAAAIFIDLHAAFDQIAIEQTRAHLHNRHIGLTLDDELHAHAASGRVAHGVQNPVTGEEIGVGDNHLALRVRQHLQVVTFDIVPVLLVIPPDEQRLRLAGLAVLFRAMAASPPAACGLFAG